MVSTRDLSPIRRWAVVVAALHVLIYAFRFLTTPVGSIANMASLVFAIGFLAAFWLVLRNRLSGVAAVLVLLLVGILVEGFESSGSTRQDRFVVETAIAMMAGVVYFFTIVLLAIDIWRSLRAG